MKASAGNQPNATHPRFNPALFTAAFGCTADGRPAHRFLRHRQPLVQSSPSTHLHRVGLLQLTVIVAGSGEGRLYRVGGRGVPAGRRRRGGQSLRSRLPRWPHRAPTPPRPPSERGRALLRRLLVPRAGRNEGAENVEIVSEGSRLRSPSRMPEDATLGAEFGRRSRSSERGPRTCRPGLGFASRNRNRVWAAKSSQHSPGSAGLGRPLRIALLPGFYQRVTDTMRRTPYGANRNVFDNLIPRHRILGASASGSDANR
jgi:hypothetical protein